MAYLCSWFEEFIARFNRIRNWDHCLCVRKKKGNRCFTRIERYVMWAIVVAAVTSLYMLLTGNIKCKSPFHLKGFFFVYRIFNT